MPKALDSRKGKLPSWLTAIGDIFGDPTNVSAGVFFPKGKTVYHGTRKLFSFFEPKRFGDPTQPASNFIHAAEDPFVARLVASEPRIIHRTESISPYSSSVRVIPIRVEPEWEILDLIGGMSKSDISRLSQAIPPRLEAARRIHSKRGPYGRYLDLEQLESVLKGREPIDETFFSLLDPEVVHRAGFSGVKYIDPGQDSIAFMFPDKAPLKTPQGTPLTAAAVRAMRMQNRILGR